MMLVPLLSMLILARMIACSSCVGRGLLSVGLSYQRVIWAERTDKVRDDGQQVAPKYPLKIGSKSGREIRLLFQNCGKAQCSQ